MAQPLIDLDALGAEIVPPDQERAAALRRSLAEPRALGRLVELAEWACGVHGGPPPRQFRRVRALSIGPPPAPQVSTIAEQAGGAVRHLADVHSVAEAFSAGLAVADDEVERGTDLLILSGAGTGVCATVAVSVLTGSEPVRVLPRGPAACVPQEWMARAVQVRDLRRHVVGFRERPAQLLQALGCVRLAAATGVLLRAAARRTPLLLDGLLALAAALVAREVAPPVAGWLQAADGNSDPAHKLVLTRLGRRPLLELDISRHDGLAGLLAVPVLRAALVATEGTGDAGEDPADA